MNNQQAWNYIGQNGKVALITLQHNRRNGDLVVLYNKDVLWAERAVRQTQIITFFIEDDLCNIHIEFALNGQVGYQFEIDRKTDTPLNRLRNKEERKGFLQGLGLLAGIVVFLSAIIGTGFFYNRYADAKALRENGRETTAFIELFPDGTQVNCRYTFLYNGVKCTFGTQLKMHGDSLMLPCGLPAHENDEVNVRFDPNEITNHTITWETPSENQITRLLLRTQARLVAQQPEMPYTLARCLVEMMYRIGGLRGLADLYYAEEPIVNNFHHNRLTFGLQSKRYDFKDDIGECF